MSSENNSLYKFADQLLEGIWILNPEGITTFVNKPMAEMLGYSPDEIIGQHLLNFIDAEEIEKTKEYVKLRQEGVKEQHESTLRHKDGGSVFVLIETGPLYDEDGEVCGAIAGIIDVSKRKKTETALKESEQMFRSLFELSDDAHVLFDGDKYIDCNDAAIKMLGLKSRQELLSLHPVDISPEYQPDGRKSAELVGENITLTMEKGSQRFEWLCQKATGDPLYLDVLLNRAKKQNIEIVHAVWRDITEQKMMEQQMRYMSYHDNLTGLYNRVFMQEEMERLDTERQLPLSIIMVDINGLKMFNDTYGHALGDALIKKAAAVLKEVSRNEDIVARWGGDEFVILLAKTSLADAESLTMRIKNSCRSAKINGIPVSMSLGAAAKTNLNTSLSDVLVDAENIMYYNKLTESRSTKHSILLGLMEVLDEKCFESKMHNANMRSIGHQFGKKLKLSDDETSRLGLLIMLHDIGKINIPDEILSKTGVLTDSEKAMMQQHPETGYRITRAVEEFSHIADDIYSHHENWDGTGYPRGLKGKKIPYLARVVSIIAAYEVMFSGRPYQDAMSREEIKAELAGCAGKRFDPSLVKSFLELIDDSSLI